MSKMDKAKYILREEWRIKEGVDYALTYKYGEFHLLCCENFKDTIEEVLAEQGLSVASMHTYLAQKKED